IGTRLSTVLGTDKKPVAASECKRPDSVLGKVVVELDCTVPEIVPNMRQLVVAVAQCCIVWRRVSDGLPFIGKELREVVEDFFGALLQSIRETRLRLERSANLFYLVQGLDQFH